jgi:hypothetical protein
MASLSDAASSGSASGEPMGFDSPNPHTRERLSMAVPVGLRNVGNTCYVNSILQTYPPPPPTPPPLTSISTSNASAIPVFCTRQIICILFLLFSSLLNCKPLLLSGTFTSPLSSEFYSTNTVLRLQLQTQRQRQQQQHNAVTAAHTKLL